MAYRAAHEQLLLRVRSGLQCKLRHACLNIRVVLLFNDMSIIVGHFVSSLKEREKSNRRDSREEEEIEGED